MAPPLPRQTLDGVPTWHHSQFPLDLLMETKGDRSVAVVLPAKNEEPTVGAIVAAIRSEFVERVPLIDELIVIDSQSEDETAAEAASAGAKVIDADSVRPEVGPVQGKGDALWRSVAATESDVIAWCDADIEQFNTRLLRGVLGPILANPDLVLAKGFYRRPKHREDGTLDPSGGGRVTELAARPLLSMLHRDLSAIIQPLSGEYAITRAAAETLPFTTGYGVEVGLLIDIVERWGIGAIGQCDLDERIHRNRPLFDLGRSSFEVIRAIVARSGVDDLPDVYRLPRRSSPETMSLIDLDVHTHVRPPHIRTPLD